MNAQRTIPVDLEDWLHNFRSYVQIHAFAFEAEASPEDMGEPLRPASSEALSTRAPIENIELFFAI
jgi:hypothetical protein